jgi:hypothetical protein
LDLDIILSRDSAGIADVDRSRPSVVTSNGRITPFSGSFLLSGALSALLLVAA